MMRTLALTTIVSIALLSNPIASAAGHFHPKGKPPSKHTIAKLKQARAALPFADKRDFEEYKKGFIAAPKSRKIMADAGHAA
jgi:alkyl sulfatase BDS1-like metallo-beta-lactamase superfamily hydrolase